MKILFLKVPEYEKQTRPYNAKNLRIIRKDKLNCAPCVSNNCKLGQPICLTGLDIQKILQGLDELIKKTKIINCEKLT